MKRYHSYTEYFREHYGERVQKLTVDAGFTCPNRDGKTGYGGCAYCNNDAFNPSYCRPSKSITQQLLEGIEFHKVRYRKAEHYLAYFQAYSNTYASPERLRTAYEEALAVPGVVGVVIGTRPDCVDDAVLDYLSALNRTCHVVVEYGVESCYNRTLERINRGHTFEQSVAAIEATHRRNIRTGAHLIFGLPDETEEDMLAEVGIINRLPLQTLKLHQLQIPVDTAFAREYAAHPERFRLFRMEEYINFVVRFLEQLRPDMVLERFANEMPPRYLIAPNWGKFRNVELWRMLERRLEELDTWQGRLYDKPQPSL
ncbi:MAG: TIGR01212 family radical SAM protein [Bacteroidales bacterium]|jgi:radical SAM protein (TIGR01212 family)|nr:TIGR01212 family radical SAM protein [Bacteroidales bacterium]